MRPLLALALTISACSSATPTPSEPPPVTVFPAASAPPAASSSPSPSPAPVRGTEARAYVLALEDMPSGFSQFDSADDTFEELIYPTIPTDETTKRFMAWDWRGDAFRAYQRPEGDIDGVVRFVTSQATVYGDAGGAAAAYADNVRRMQDRFRGTFPVSMGGEVVGDESSAIQFPDESDGILRRYLVYFRAGNVTNNVSVVGIRRDFPITTVIAYARRQLAKIRR